MERTERSVNSPIWMRALRIGAGAACVALSIAAIAYPGLAVEKAVWLLILLIVGIDQIARGVFVYRSHRAAHIGIEILVITLSSAAMTFPMFLNILAHNSYDCQCVIYRLTLLIDSV